MENQEFHRLLLLLCEDIQEKDIPHRTTMTTHILQLHQEYLNHLSANMLVSYLIYYIHCIELNFSRKTPWERSPLPWICGQTWI